MHLSRTTFAYEETISHLQKFGRNPLIEIYLVQYLLILFYSEVEDKIKEIVIPILIIRPKFITGSIFDKTKEAKPTTVVIIAKKQGTNFDKTVLTTNLY